MIWTVAHVVFLIVIPLYEASEQPEEEHVKNVNVTDESHPKHHAFLHSIFNKYGNNGLMTFEGFEHLLENLGIGNVRIQDHDIHDHYDENGFRELHADHNHTQITDADPVFSAENATRHDDHNHDHDGHGHHHDHSHDHDATEAKTVVHDHDHGHSDDDDHGHDATEDDARDDHGHGHDATEDSKAGTVVHGAVDDDHDHDAHHDDEADAHDHESHHKRRRRFAETEADVENTKVSKAFLF